MGTINTASGPLDIVVERITPKNSGPVWLFSRQTLSVIPDVYAEVDLVRVDPYLPDSLAKPRILGIRLFEWLVLFLVLPLCYRLLAITNWLVAPLLAFVRRRSGVLDAHADRRVPGLFRLVILGIAIRWIVASLELPFFERQFWWAVAGLMLIVALGWSLVLLNAVGERYFTRRLAGSGEVTLLLRLARRGADGLGIALCVFVVLRYFGFDPTAALAGLGIGGIAVALAAQKTLENVIAGLSLIFDKAVRVGDALKFNGMIGTVDHIGLRSTRIRTLDRFDLSVPNGQIAAGGIETLSARDKFRFYHVVGLQYGTTVQQMRSVIEGVRTLLLAHPSVDADSVRVRFFRLGAFSLDIEVAVYIFADDWERFSGDSAGPAAPNHGHHRRRGDGHRVPLADGPHRRRRRARCAAQVTSSTPTPLDPPLKVAQSA